MLKTKKLFRKMGALIIATVVLIGVMPVKAAYIPNVSVWDGSVNTSWFSDELTRLGIAETDIGWDTVFYINSAADFIAFRNKVVSGTTQQAWGGGPYYPFYKSRVRLNCDIDLAGLNLKYGIGGWSKGDQFCGIFDGQGHIIKNVSINPNLPDAALVQPTANPNINTRSYATNGTLTGESSPYMMGLFPFCQYINASSGKTCPSITNVNIEDEEITLPDTVLTSETAQYVGGLVGWAYNGIHIAGCTVKNVTFKGGPSNYTAGVSGVRYFMGGLAGTLQGASPNAVYDCYTDGVDFTQLDLPVGKNWCFMSGLFTYQNQSVLNNLYTANVTYDADNTVYFDSFVYPYGGSASVTSKDRDGNTASNACLYAEEPKRITAGNNVAVTLNDTYTVETLTPNVAWNTTYGGTHHMIDMSAFDGGYARTPAEMFIAGKNGSFMTEGGTTVTSIAQAGGANVKATFDTLNTTTANQTVNVILAKYQGTELKGVVVDTVTVKANDYNDETIGGIQWGKGVIRVNKDSSNKYTVYTQGNVKTTAESTSSISTTGCDSIRAFLWNSTEDMEAFANYIELN